MLFSTVSSIPKPETSVFTRFRERSSNCLLVFFFSFSSFFEPHLNIMKTITMEPTAITTKEPTAIITMEPTAITTMEPMAITTTEPMAITTTELMVSANRLGNVQTEAQLSNAETHVFRMCRYFSHTRFFSTHQVITMMVPMVSAKSQRDGRFSERPTIQAG